MQVEVQFASWVLRSGKFQPGGIFAMISKKSQDQSLRRPGRPQGFPLLENTLRSGQEIQRERVDEWVIGVEVWHVLGFWQRF